MLFVEPDFIGAGVGRMLFEAPASRCCGSWLALGC
jgi:hypothetical protein